MLSTFRLLEYFKRFPVFTLNQFSLKTGHAKTYAKVFLHRLVKKGLVYRIERGKYTVYDTPLIIASHIVQPSYLTLWTALSFYGLTTQLPRDIFVACKSQKKAVIFQDTRIRFISAKPDGFTKVLYQGVQIFIAEKEKLLVDILNTGLVPSSELEELVSEIDMQKMVTYLLKIGNKSLMKRVGFLLEQYGRRAPELLKKIDANYVPLLQTMKRKGKKDKTWKIIDNRP